MSEESILIVVVYYYMADVLVSEFGGALPIAPLPIALLFGGLAAKCFCHLPW